jgi:hypothetical protein
VELKKLFKKNFISNKATYDDEFEEASQIAHQRATEQRLLSRKVCDKNLGSKKYL